jgi:hypothetical protein
MASPFKWYKKLAEVDPELLQDDMAAHLDEYITQLNRREVQVSQTSVPLSFANELYHLRLHIEMLREKMIKASRRSNKNTSSA